MTGEQEKQSKLLDGEEVYFVIDYWDGPREGVADYCGTPHYFRGVFDEKRDVWSDVFILSPLDQDTYHLLMEPTRFGSGGKRHMRAVQLLLIPIRLSLKTQTEERNLLKS